MPDFMRSRMPSPLGDLFIVTDDDALISLDFDGHNARMLDLLRIRFGEVHLSTGDTPAHLRDVMNAYFAGDLTAIDQLPVRPYGTDFQERVWHGLRRIPAGSFMAYGDLARELGMNAHVDARAVGHANSQNPIAIVLPCHRVIGADGKLTGYAGGLKRKEWLLRHEGALLV
jgi:methylated-DNA-[protein]-cysteine S-methyltransferase